MVVNSPPTAPPPAEDDDSEWEYEYHETETEVGSKPSAEKFALTNILQTFYVTLDLSSSSAFLRSKRNADITDPDLRHAVPASATAGSESNSNAAAGIRQAAAASGDDAEVAPSATIGDGQAGTPSETEDRIQILDFHSPNPIVSYQNQIYSCEWTSTIGTDVLLRTPEPTEPHPVLRQGPGVSIVAATNLKLSGRPVQLDSRERTSSEKKIRDKESASDSSGQADKNSGSKQVTSVQIPEGLAPNRVRQNQANFLQRLIAVKAAKGETDEVTVYAQRTNQGSGWRSQQHALAERRASEAGEGREHEEGITRLSSNRRGRIGRPRRGTWRTSGPRTAKGGLFRDYRPQLWDTEGADIANNSTRTPDTWGQIEGRESSRHSSAVNDVISSSATPTSQPLAVPSEEPQTPSQRRDEEGPEQGHGEDDANGSEQGPEDMEMEDV